MLKQLKIMLMIHRGIAVVTCDLHCFCWVIDAYVSMLEENASEQGVHLTKSRWAQFWDKLFAAFRR